MLRKKIKTILLKSLKIIILSGAIILTMGNLKVGAIEEFKLKEEDIIRERIPFELKEEDIIREVMNKNMGKHIVLEAGHGYNHQLKTGDPGAIGVDNVFEADRTLNMAQELKGEFEKMGYRVTIVRDGNYFLSLGEKQKQMRELQPDLSLSLHFNSSVNPSSTGAETFSNTLVYDKFGKPLPEILSKKIAHAQGIVDRGNKTVGEAPNQVKLYTRSNRLGVPNILLETCFISNPNDIARYEESKNEVIKTIVETINNFFK